MFLIEYACKKSLQRTHRDLNFLISNRTLYYFTHYYRQFNFDEIDPLLGWSNKSNTIEASGLSIFNNCISLSNTNKNIVIFITGGSTGDVMLNAQNWPTHLQQLLNKKRISAVVVVGAVGGYNSGQELLKTMRDGVRCKPFIHISYSGANDIEFSGYVSPYEYSIFKEALNGGPPSPYFPNTIAYAKGLLLKHPDTLSLKTNSSESPDSFYCRNMQMMHALSCGFNYHFLGILQPVINSGRYVQAETEAANDFHAPLYKKHYPYFKKFVENTPYMASFTNIFDTCTNRVFSDDCHITDSYQKLVAEKVYEELTARKLITSEDAYK